MEEFLREVALTALSKDEMRVARPWLNSWTRLEKEITHFTERQLAIFIIYEAAYRKRETVIRRLMSRYMKLKRERVTELILNIINQRKLEEIRVYERAGNRTVSMQASEGEERGSD